MIRKELLFISCFVFLFSNQSIQADELIPDEHAVIPVEPAMEQPVAGDSAKSVERSDKAMASATKRASDRVLDNPWYQTISISGSGAAGYYDTGEDGTKPQGGFEIKEATLFIEAQIWQDVDFFVELQTNRLGKDDQLYSRTGEVYVHAQNFALWSDNRFGMKIGRFDIPFGEEYLWLDSVNNPLISNSVSLPYGQDEGLLFYGELWGIGWVTSITDGTDARSEEDDSDKAFNIKLFTTLFDSLYISASYMANGDAAKSGIALGGSHFEPLGVDAESTLGESPSDLVGATLVQLDSKFSFALFGKSAYIGLSGGAAELDDVVADIEQIVEDATAQDGERTVVNRRDFKRTLRWLTAESRIDLSTRFYIVGRYSEIGTFDADEGYHFDGQIFAGGHEDFGYDVERVERVAVGLGFQANPNTLIKFELGQDDFLAIVDSEFAVDNDERDFIGMEVAVRF